MAQNPCSCNGQIHKSYGNENSGYQYRMPVGPFDAGDSTRNIFTPCVQQSNSVPQGSNPFNCQPAPLYYAPSGFGQQPNPLSWENHNDVQDFVEEDYCPKYDPWELTVNQEKVWDPDSGVYIWRESAVTPANSISKMQILDPCFCRTRYYCYKTYKNIPWDLALLALEYLVLFGLLIMFLRWLIPPEPDCI